MSKRTGKFNEYQNVLKAFAVLLVLLLVMFIAPSGERAEDAGEAGGEPAVKSFELRLYITENSTDSIQGARTNT